jgi:hypothetical protein
MKKNDRTHLAVLVGAFVVLGGLYFASRQSGGGLGPAASRGFGELKLAAVGGGETALKSCPTARCLNVYMSPWCGVCRASTDLIKELRPWLAERGVATRVIIGRDRPDAVTDYAKVFGPETLVDAEGRFPLQGGVPQFVISDGEGRILRSQPGVLRIVRPPIPESELDALARALDLL